MITKMQRAQRSDNPQQAGLSLIVVYACWSIPMPTGSRDDSRSVGSGARSRALEPGRRMFNDIQAVVERHDAEMRELREREKKDPAGETASSATLDSVA